MTQLADLNGDCTLALLKRFSSAQLFTFISSPQVSRRQLYDCAVVALKEVYAPLSLKSAFGRYGQQVVYVADAKNAKLAVLKHPALFQLSPLSGFLSKADIQLSDKFGPANLQTWFDIAESIVISQLQRSQSFEDSPPRGTLLRQLVHAFSAARTLCICISPENLPKRRRTICVVRDTDSLRGDKIGFLLDTVGVGLLRASLRSLKIVSRPASCVAVELSSFLKLRLLFLQYLPRSGLESVDFRGIFIEPTRCFPAPWPEGDARACELLLCDMLPRLRTNRALKCIKLRCHIQSISKLQVMLPGGCKIVELNGEPVLNEAVLSSMHCSPERLLIVQEKNGINEADQLEKLYLHVDCTPPLPN